MKPVSLFSIFTKKKGRFLFFLSLIFLSLILSGCFMLLDITDSPYGFAGRWQGMPLYHRGVNIDGNKPEFIFFAHINQIGGKIFGVLSRVDSYGFSEGPISGKQEDKKMNFTVKFHHENLTFEGSWVDDQKAWVGKWTSDLGKSGEALFEIHKTDSDQTKGLWPLRNKLMLKGGHGKPVIFIHGMNSNANRWNKLLEQLQKNGFYDTYQVWVFQYNWAEPITTNGQDLFNKINEEGIQNPIIVAHSMGGLVSRSFIAQGGTIEKLVTFGTPHHGTPLADLGARLLGSNNFSTWLQDSLLPGVADLKEASPYINGLTANQNDLENRKKYIVIASAMDGQLTPITVCQEGECSSRVVWKWTRDDYYDLVSLVCYCMIPGENDGYVPEDSALFKGSGVLPQNQIFLNGFLEHTQLVDPDKSSEIIPILMNLD